MPDLPAVQDLELAYYVDLFGAAETEGMTLPDLRYKYYLYALSGMLSPPRLSPTGKQVVDWNAVDEAGFYWSDGTALNEPAPGTPAQGVVTAGFNNHVEQMLTVLTQV